MKSYKRFINKSKSVNEMYGLDQDIAMEIINAAGQYTSDADEAANQMWDSAEELISYLKSDHIPKKYHKAFDKGVARFANESVNESAKLVDEKTGKVVKLPYKTKDFRGDAIVVKGFSEPRHSASSGRIQTDQGEFFPGVAGLKIVGHQFESVKEGNAFSAARAKAIANDEKTFKVGDEEYDVEDVDAEDKENAEEFIGEAGDVKLMKRKLDSIVGSTLTKIIDELAKKGFSKEEIEKYLGIVVSDRVEESFGKVNESDVPSELADYAGELSEIEFDDFDESTAAQLKKLSKKMSFVIGDESISGMMTMKDVIKILKSNNIKFVEVNGDESMIVF